SPGSHLDGGNRLARRPAKLRTAIHFIGGTCRRREQRPLAKIKPRHRKPRHPVEATAIIKCPSWRPDDETHSRCQVAMVLTKLIALRNCSGRAFFAVVISPGVSLF